MGLAEQPAVKAQGGIALERVVAEQHERQAVGHERHRTEPPRATPAPEVHDQRRRTVAKRDALQHTQDARFGQWLGQPVAGRIHREEGKPVQQEAAQEDQRRAPPDLGPDRRSTQRLVAVQCVGQGRTHDEQETREDHVRQRQPMPAGMQQRREGLRFADRHVDDDHQRQRHATHDVDRYLALRQGWHRGRRGRSSGGGHARRGSHSHPRPYHRGPRDRPQRATPACQSPLRAKPLIPRVPGAKGGAHHLALCGPAAPLRRLACKALTNRLTQLFNSSRQDRLGLLGQVHGGDESTLRMVVQAQLTPLRLHDAARDAQSQAQAGIVLFAPMAQPHMRLEHGV